MSTPTLDPLTRAKLVLDETWHQQTEERLHSYDTRMAIERIMEGLNHGTIRLAEKVDGAWKVNAWVQQAILLYFKLRSMEVTEAGVIEFHDKIPLKRNWIEAGVRVVPGAVVRYAAFIEPGVVIMPSFVNIGARVGSGTMIDTWATVGSGAQVGRDVHVAGGVGIGGVLEPPGARPVIIEDGCFIGSRCVVVEGVLVEEEAVLGAGTMLYASTKIVDVTQDPPVIHQGRVPPRSVVIPGTMPKQFPGGVFQVPCALIIGQRTASTDRKTSLNQALREFSVSA